MKKNIFDIELVKGSTIVSNKGKNNTNRVKFSNGGKGLLIINPIGLSVGFCDQPSLTMINGPIGFELDGINPLAPNKDFVPR